MRWNNFFTILDNRILKLFTLECKVSGWKVYLTNTSTIKETILSSNITVTDCKEKCNLDKDCLAFEAHCRKEPVSSENFFIQNVFLIFDENTIWVYLWVVISNSFLKKSNQTNGLNQGYCVCKKFDKEITEKEVIRVKDSFVGLSNGERNNLHQISQNIIILKYI